jgi:hypothetical protein
MHKYIYYDAESGQVEAVFSSNNLSTNASCEARGLRRAVVPHSMNVTRNHKVEVGVGDVREDDGTLIETTTVVTSVSDSVNPAQPDRTKAEARAAAKISGNNKLKDLGLTDAEIEAIRS